MQGQSESLGVARRAGFGRAFGLLVAPWVVAQAHHGLFAGRWADSASLPGNLCWLLILYCLLRLGMGWMGVARRDRRMPPELAAPLLIVAMLELASVTSGDPLAHKAFGQLMFLVQPLIVLLGFAALHRQQPQRA